MNFAFKQDGDIINIDVTVHLDVSPSILYCTLLFCKYRNEFGLFTGVLINVVYFFIYSVDHFSDIMDIF